MLKNMQIYHFLLAMQIQELLLFMQEFICAKVIIGLKKVYLKQMYFKGKPTLLTKVCKVDKALM